ncbi:MAG TPA: DUF924 family protein [Steroidobacter sp.]|uniref:DUF924 family protein n=1 Tax=Steroidobacter sp. TaxID=1978227 RepID=UPI002EDA9E68
MSSKKLPDVSKGPRPLSTEEVRKKSRLFPDGWAEDVLHFWFQELQPRDWFSSHARLDEKIRERFGDLCAALRDDPPALERADVRTMLAAIIVFDQFPRNIYRGTPAAYATDSNALALAKSAVANGKDRLLPEKQRHFLYMPFMHSEDRATQAESMRLFSELDPDGMKWARHHYDVVERFGRFPHRNAILGRQSTPEEQEFLKNEPSLV